MGGCAINRDMKKLSRAIDLPYPEKLPQNFSMDYPEQCRAIKAEWNMLYRKIPYEEYYKVSIG